MPFLAFKSLLLQKYIKKFTNLGSQILIPQQYHTTFNCIRRFPWDTPQVLFFVTDILCNFLQLLFKIHWFCKLSYWINIMWSAELIQVLSCSIARETSPFSPYNICCVHMQNTRRLDYMCMCNSSLIISTEL